MLKVYVVVEGYTERAVIQQVFAPHLANQGILLFPRIIGKPGKKGGDCKFQRVLPEICNLILQENDTFVTTFFDYYALPTDWPNREESRQLSSFQQKAETIETGLKEAVLGEFKKLDPIRFIPYIQMHELEALLFADCKVMGDILGCGEFSFQKILDDHEGECEAINDSKTTAPSKRIMEIVPFYKKGSSVNAHGWRILKQIGMQKIRKQCIRFNDWVHKLELLAATQRHAESYKPPSGFTEAIR